MGEPEDAVAASGGGGGEEAALASQLGGLGLGDGGGPPAAPAPPPPPPLAGCAHLMAALAETIAWPHVHADKASRLGLAWPRGLLIHGPPGTGKSAAVRAAAAAHGALLLTITPGSVFGPFVGDSERRLRRVWARAAAAAAAAPGRPVVILLDDAHALAPARSAAGAHEGRVVATLLTLLDGAAAGGGGAAGTIAPAIIATTARPAALDPALRRAGRLDREVAVPLPAAPARAAILALHASRLPLAADVDLAAIAAGARGLSGADLAAVAREAARTALTSAAAAATAEGGANPATARPVSAADFKAALATVGASATRGLRPLELPPAVWADVGGLEAVKERLTALVAWPITRAPAFARLGLSPPRGVLLYGPPGCSKTTLARAAATAAGAPLHALSGAALFSAYLGEGEATLRAAFAAARAAAPAIVFLDEVDALGGRRSGGAGSSGAGDPGARMLAALLAELDGLEAGPPGCLLVLAATNRPHALDAALLRPGRLDAHVYVPPPDAAGRAAALAVHTRGMPLARDVDLEGLGRGLPDGLTGAEVAAVAREAALAAAREGAVQVRASHFAAAAAVARPGVEAAELAAFEAWGRRR